MDDEKLKSITNTIRERYDGEMSLLEVGGVEIIAAVPNKATFAQFRDGLLDEKKRGRAFETLVRGCLLYPSQVEFEAIVSKRPALVLTLAEKIAEMAGSGLVVEEKKL